MAGSCALRHQEPQQVGHREDETFQYKHSGGARSIRSAAQSESPPQY